MNLICQGHRDFDFINIGDLIETLMILNGFTDIDYKNIFELR